MREIAATILVGLLGAIALTVAFVVPLMLLRSIVRYHLETEQCFIEGHDGRAHSPTPEHTRHRVPSLGASDPAC